jgi:hypothetical protein
MKTGEIPGQYRMLESIAQDGRGLSGSGHKEPSSFSTRNTIWSIEK